MHQKSQAQCKSEGFGNCLTSICTTVVQYIVPMRFIGQRILHTMFIPMIPMFIPIFHAAVNYINIKILRGRTILNVILFVALFIIIPTLPGFIWWWLSEYIYFDKASEIFYQIQTGVWRMSAMLQRVNSPLLFTLSDIVCPFFLKGVVMFCPTHVLLLWWPQASQINV